MRTFLAVDFSKELQQTARTVRNRISEKIQRAIAWTVPENLHLTLRFFGATTEEQSQRIVSRYQEVFLRYAPFELNFVGVGVFPHERHPRVLWIGLEAGGGLKEMAEECETVAREIGFEAEQRAFVPHLTLGKFKGRVRAEELSESLAAFRGERFGSARVSEAVLYESRTLPTGAVYQPLRIFKLSENENAKT